MIRDVEIIERPDGGSHIVIDGDLANALERAAARLKCNPEDLLARAIRAVIARDLFEVIGKLGEPVRRGRGVDVTEDFFGWEKRSKT